MPEPDVSELRPDWINISVLTGVHLAGIAAILYLALVKCDPATLLLALALFWVVGLSVTGGYHRLFAHRTYRAIAPLRLFYLLFGTAAVQNSALRWAADHRVHHAHADHDGDPYNITRGFWWAHVGWVLFHSPPHPDEDVRDLQADPLVAWQHRWYVPLAVVFGIGLPTAIAALWGDALGGLLVAGFLRLVLQWQTTFTINSVAHWIGSRPYCTTTSARDSSITALISFGEGYHNFHHRFQADYRNGVRWWQLDPTKWFVWTMSRLGIASDLRVTPPEAIRRAREAVLAQRA